MSYRIIILFLRSIFLLISSISLYSSDEFDDDVQLLRNKVPQMYELSNLLGDPVELSSLKGNTIAESGKYSLIIIYI